MSSSSSSSKEEFPPGFSDATTFRNASMGKVGAAIKAANGLPSKKKEDWVFYSTFSQFRKVMTAEKQKIETVMKEILKWNEIKGLLPTSSVPDMMDFLTEANDQMLERLNSSLDEASGMKKENEAMLIEVAQKSKTILSGSWNARQAKKGSEENDGQLKLVTAKNVSRPQINFQTLIDNSSKPFVPRLREKPNAKKPLSILVEYDADGNEYYSHPYIYELNLFKPEDHCKHVLEKADISSEPPNVEKSEFVYVDTEADLLKMIANLKKEKEIAVDLEHHWYRSFQGITSLIQISARKTDFIIDPFPLWHKLTALNEIFTDPKIVKVFHGADNDLMWLQRDFSVYVVNLFDTHQAAVSLQFPHGTRKYASLLNYYFKVHADKRFQLADWRIRPLPEDMVKYARVDTHYLLHLYRRMKNELLERGNEFQNLVKSTFSTCNDMCKRIYRKPVFSEDSYLDLVHKSKVSLNSRQTYALKHVFAWRNKLARDLDESEQYVLPNHMLLKMCTELPREMQGILACCNPIPPIVKQELQSIHLIILKAREQSLTVISHSMDFSSDQSLKPDVNFSNNVMTELVDDPLRSPLDLQPMSDLHVPCVLDQVKGNSLQNDQVISLTNPAIDVFSSTKKHRSKKPSNAKFPFLSPYQRFKMLQPYLKYLDAEANGESVVKDVGEKIRSIREHFDAMTAMTPEEFTSETQEAQKEEDTKEVKNESGNEEEEEEVLTVIKSIRVNKKAEKKKAMKRRKKFQNDDPGSSSDKKIKQEVDKQSDTSASSSINFENADFSQFSKKSLSKVQSDQYDPWKDHKKFSSGGKKRQNMKNKGKSHSYRK